MSTRERKEGSRGTDSAMEYFRTIRKNETKTESFVPSEEDGEYYDHQESQG